MFDRYRFLWLLLFTSLGSLYADIGKQVPNITVWVHGTTVRAWLNSQSLVDKMVKTELVPFSSFRKNSKAYKRAHWLCDSDSKKYPLEGFYIFRWSGLLGDSRRESAAKVLFESLQKEYQRIYEKYGKYPKVTIFTHSHGGNLVLNMATINNKKHKSDFVVDHLVMFACPVIKSTSNLLYDSFFKEVYSFYSTSDYVQTMSMGFLTGFSKRRFCKNDKKLTQIAVSWLNSELWHNDFKSSLFAKYLPEILNQVARKNSNTDTVGRNYSLVIGTGYCGKNNLYRMLGF